MGNGCSRRGSDFFDDAASGKWPCLFHALHRTLFKLSGSLYDFLSHPLTHITKVGGPWGLAIFQKYVRGLEIGLGNKSSTAEHLPYMRGPGPNAITEKKKQHA